MTNGKQKGSRAEREVSQMLEAWWNVVEPGCKFRRTPSSGGWASEEIRGETQTSGDIVTTAKLFPFCVEVKHRETWSEKGLWKGFRSPVWSWWTQCIKAAKEMKKIPFLIFRKNRGQWFIIVPESEALRITTVKPFATWTQFGKGVKMEVWPICYLASDILAESAVKLVNNGK